MHLRSTVFVLVALIATSTNAALMPRQDTSSVTSDSTTAATSSTPTATPTTTPPTTALATSTSSLLPVVSVEDSGVLVTITPTASASPSATGAGNSNGTSSAPACVASNYALNGNAAPFCLPANGTDWIQNTSYPVTWNPDFWPDYQGTVVIALIYTGKDGSDVITQDNEIANQRGFFNIDVESSWLKGNTVVAARLLIAPNQATSSNGGAHFGPVVSLQDSATPVDTSAPRFNSRSLAIIIAIPVSIVAVAVLLFTICYCTRKQRRLPEGLLVPRNGGRKSKRGYAEARSRRKRTGVEKSPDEFEMGTVSGYHDEPADVYSDAPEHTDRDAHY